jgi:hypothetical protein
VDAGQLTQAFIIAGILLGIGRLVVTTVGRAEGGIAILFVPPDRRLGWPHGVQESDEPWGWHPPATTPTEVFEAAGLDNEPTLPAEAPLPEPVAGSFVVDPKPVDPITFHARRH